MPPGLAFVFRWVAKTRILGLTYNAHLWKLPVRIPEYPRLRGENLRCKELSNCSGCARRNGLANVSHMEGFAVLAISVSDDDCVFVFSRGQDIGAICLGAIRPVVRNPKATLLFAGGAAEFEILRDAVVAKRFGVQELERLRAKYGVCPRSFFANPGLPHGADPP
jgi:hypothetical protein